MTKRKTKTPGVRPSHLTNNRSSVVSKESSAFFGFDVFLNKNGYWILIGLMAVMALFVFKDFILQQKFYFYRDVGSDQITQVYTNLYHIAEYLRTDGLPRWSFNQGLGQNIYPFSLSDPFVDILYIFGKANAAGGLVYIEILIKRLIIVCTNFAVT